MKAKLICLILLVLTASAVTAEEPFYNDEPIAADLRLETIKASLLDYALDHSVYVSTQAWLDGNGAVEEKVLLLSGLNLERIRVNEYRNALGIAQASIIDAPLTATESWYGCPVTSPVRRRIELVSHIDQTGSAAARNLAIRARNAVLDTLITSRSLAVSAKPFINQQHNGSVYARYMQQPAAQQADLVLHIHVAAQQRAARSLFAPSLRDAGSALSIELVMSELDQVIYRAEFQARVPKLKLAATMPNLSDDLLSDLTAAVDKVAEELGDQIRCQASSKLNVSQIRGQLRIDGGTDLGVFPGQEFLLVPSSRGFATRGLEDALASVALVRVDRVYSQHATLAVVTGASAKMMSSEMIAVPLASMDFM